MLFLWCMALQLASLETRDAVNQLRSNNPQIGLVMVAVNPAIESVIRDVLQVPYVFLSSLDQLGSYVDALVEEMRVAVGIERDLVDPPTPAGSK